MPKQEGEEVRVAEFLAHGTDRFEDVELVQERLQRLEVGVVHHQCQCLTHLGVAMSTLWRYPHLIGWTLPGAAVVFEVGFGGWLIGLAITGLVVALVNLIFHLGVFAPRR